MQIVGLKEVMFLYEWNNTLEVDILFFECMFKWIEYKTQFLNVLYHGFMLQIAKNSIPICLKKQRQSR